MTVSCVVVGALCEDMIRGRGPERREIGGTAFYFSASMAALGAKTGCVTKTMDRWMLARIKSNGVPLEGVHRGNSCCFELDYGETRRKLRLLRRSSKITAREIPDSMKNFGGLHLGPVEDELDSSIWRLRDRYDFISLDIQGLARVMGGDGGEVYLSGSLDSCVDAISASDVVKFSEEEAHQILGRMSQWGDRATRLRKLGPATTIVTLGPRGALLFEGGEAIEIPPYPSEPVDWTGAGDCFMAGFDFARLSGSNSIEAANFGSALAALVIESPRPVTFPSTGDVEEKLAGIEDN